MRESTRLLQSSGETVHFSGAYEGDQMLWQLSYIIRTAQTKQIFELLLNGEEKTFFIFVQF
jgi:hypothetical protein